MSKPFDLEQAKQGKPFVRSYKPDSQCRFVGVRLNGKIVIEYQDGKTKDQWYLDYFNENQLEMLPEKKEIKVLIVKCPNGEITVWKDTPDNKLGLSTDAYFRDHRLLCTTTVIYEV